MALSYNYVMPPTGLAENAVVREMFDDVKAFVDTLVVGGTVAPVDATYVTLSTNATLTNERVLTAGLGIGLTDNGAGSTIVLTNNGVRSLSTTDVNLSFSASTGAITAAFASTPTFSSLILQSASGSIGITPSGSAFTTYNLTLPLNTGSNGQFLKTNGATPTATLSWADPSAVTDIHGTANQISVSSTTGSVTLSTPQDIATSSRPTFAGVLLGDTVLSDLPIKLGGTLDGLGHDSVSRAVLMQSQGATAKIEQLGSSSHGTFDLFTSSGGLKGSYLRLINSGTIDIVPYSGASYTLTLPPDDGSLNQYLTTDGSGNLTWTNAAGTGTVNTGTANRLAYYAASTDAVSALSAVTPNMALISDASGLPTQSTASAAELAFVHGVTSAIQTQLDAKAAKALSNLASVAINSALLPGTDNSIDLGSASKRWVNIFAKDIDAGASGTAGTVDIYPSTSATGKIQVTAAANAGDTVTTLVNASQAGARTYTIPDAGASASFVMTEGAQTVNGALTLGAALAMGAHKITGIASASAATDVPAFSQVKVVQVVSATSTTRASTTSSTFQTTNCSASITPSSTSNKILILASGHIVNTAATLTAAAVTIARGGTNILSSLGGAYVDGPTAGTVDAPCHLSFLDSPGSVAALTYAVQIKSTDNTSTVRFGDTNVTQSIILVEVNGI